MRKKKHHGACDERPLLERQQVTKIKPYDKVPPCKIRECIYYIDRIRVLFKTRLYKEDVRYLTDAGRNPPNVFESKATQYQTRIDLCQPTSSEMERLEALCLKYFGAVSQCELACDLVVESKKAAHQIGRWLRHVAIVRNRRTNYFCHWRNTVYTAPPTGNGNLVVYADRPSKMNGKPCAHFEMRVGRMRSCRSLNVILPSSLSQDQIPKLINRCLYFAEVDVRSLGLSLLHREGKIGVTTESAIEHARGVLRGLNLEGEENDEVIHGQIVADFLRQQKLRSNALRRFTLEEAIALSL